LSKVIVASSRRTTRAAWRGYSKGRLFMAPCHIPGYRSAEYEQAFDELWALACHGQVTVDQVRQEMMRLHWKYVVGLPRHAGAEQLGEAKPPAPDSISPVLAAVELW
jgi:hypothetical protein